jgi:hypothetical protein
MYLRQYFASANLYFRSVYLTAPRSHLTTISPHHVRPDPPHPPTLAATDAAAILAPAKPAPVVLAAGLTPTPQLRLKVGSIAAERVAVILVASRVS